MTVHVLDASFVVKLAVREPGSDEARAWFAENGGEDFQAPALLASELGRALQKGQGKPASRCAEVHARTLQPIAIAPPEPTADGVWALADTFSFYDAEYVRLAQRAGGVLVTADKKMAERARKLGVQVKEFSA